MGILNLYLAFDRSLFISLVTNGQLKRLLIEGDSTNTLLFGS